MAVSTFNVVERGIVTAEELDSIFAQLLSSPGWSDFSTKSSHRLYDQWSYDRDPQTPPPAHLRFLGALMSGLMAAM
eukprot:CAMPEP_0197906816 /NCGR_PEP_ID=MMETSP1439-20131203/63523_1 /TAXON_ID=66791 /ORGANISM="Gonyaulax spinifera, Strain CCMP409" /LENGTH=75 /DNA_ID=CAMNT_0043528209 /DNA_START=67 /DNA_END=291 /DNA_ORIENTATION=+